MEEYKCSKHGSQLVCVRCLMEMTPVEAAKPAADGKGTTVTNVPPTVVDMRLSQPKSETTSYREWALISLEEGNMPRAAYDRLLEAVTTYFRLHKRPWPRDPSNARKRSSLLHVLETHGFQESWYRGALGIDGARLVDGEHPEGAQQ